MPILDLHGELLKLGFDISQRSVARLMPRLRRTPSQSWKTFLANHVTDLAFADFFVVPTATFRVPFVLVFLRQHRPRAVHWNVTESPSAWTAQQIVDAFPEDNAPRHLLRDRDGIYGEVFHKRMKSLGIEEVLTRSSLPLAESPCRAGSIRREFLDHVIVLGEDHLRRRLDAFFPYYHRSHTHLSLGKHAPEAQASLDDVDALMRCSAVAYGSRCVLGLGPRPFPSHHSHASASAREP